MKKVQNRVDHLNNVIQINDILMYTSIKQCRGLMIGRVESFTPKRIKVINLSTGERSIVHAKHSVVITQQLNWNMSCDGAGFSDKRSQRGVGQTVKSYLESIGVNVDEESENLRNS